MDVVGMDVGSMAAYNSSGAQLESREIRKRCEKSRGSVHERSCMRILLR